MELNKIRSGMRLAPSVSGDPGEVASAPGRG